MRYSNRNSNFGKRGSRRGPYRPDPSFNKRTAVSKIIIANIAVFVGMIFLSFIADLRVITPILGLVPKWTWSRFFVWQPVTYMFVHGGFWHIFWNMFILWMFGRELESIWGKKEFYKYYFVTGIGSGIITLLFSLNSTIPVVGASGAIYGLLIAFGLMFPSRRIYLWFLIPIQAKYLVLILGAITFFSTFSGQTSNVSHLTHLGGLIIGFIYLKYYGMDLKTPSLNIPFNIKNPFKNMKNKFSIEIKDSADNFPEDTPKENLKKHTKYKSDETFRERMNEILDKINREGYDNLTEKEKRTLYLASKYFSDENKKN